MSILLPSWSYRRLSQEGKKLFVELCLSSFKNLCVVISAALNLHKESISARFEYEKYLHREAAKMLLLIWIIPIRLIAGLSAMILLAFCSFILAFRQ